MENASEELWGHAGGRSSTDAAYDLCLDKEAAQLVGDHSLVVLLGMLKCCETGIHSAMFDECRANSIRLSTTVATDIKPRDFVDDVAFRVGSGPGGSRQVAATKVVKSGHLAMTRKAAYHFKVFAKMLKIMEKPHVRYVGHDLAADAAVRVAQKTPLKQMHDRKGRLRTLQRGAGKARVAISVDVKGATVCGSR
ncbi:unnamed protein product, partial [Prorocentrum cordatum]